MPTIMKLAEVVANGNGQLYAQVAENREYRCWALSPSDIAKFHLRVYDEIEIEMAAEDQFCRVIRRDVFTT